MTASRLFATSSLCGVAPIYRLAPHLLVLLLDRPAGNVHRIGHTVVVARRNHVVAFVTPQGVGRGENSASTGRVWYFSTDSPCLVQPHGLHTHRREARSCWSCISSTATLMVRWKPNLYLYLMAIQSAAKCPFTMLPFRTGLGARGQCYSAPPLCCVPMRFSSNSFTIYRFIFG